MRARIVASGLFVAVVALIAGLQLIGGDDAYQLNLRLKSANGLRDGSEVRTGGVPIGRVVSLTLGPQDAVDVKLALDDGHDAVGADATARIVATNLVGEKYVELAPGDTRRRMADGAWLPPGRVSTSVDLDQVLDVLDADVRTRLGILINETGFALTHRRTDFNAFLHQLPLALDAGQKLVAQLAGDNHTIGDVVTHSDRLVAKIDGERGELNRVVETAGRTAATVAGKRAQLRAALAAAPGTLASAQRLLTSLETTTKPLGPAARLVTATAPSLRSTLTEVRPFEAHARPALDEVPDLAPALSRLAVKAAPVVRQAVPAAQALANLATTSGHASRTLGASIDDLLGLAEGWSRSIQLRDGLSHVFRGRASISVDTIQTLTRRLLLLNRDKDGGARKQATAPGREGRPAPGAGAASGPGDPAPAQPAAPGVGGALKKLLPGLAPGGQQEPAPAPAPGGNSVQQLLDYLLKP
jgi:phospholipid/cholesterol/gamma-HCH transport system substrate-binding protein